MRDSISYNHYDVRVLLEPKSHFFLKITVIEESYDVAWIPIKRYSV